MTDVWLKLTGNDAQAVAALRTLGLVDEMTRRGGEDGKGPPQIGDAYGPEVNVHYEPDLLISRDPEVFDGPHLMVRFLSERLRSVAAQKIIEHRPDLPDGTPQPPLPRQLPVGLEVIPDPGTVRWS